MKKNVKKWTMPEWMEPFRQFLTEPDRAEEYKNCDGVNCNVVVNAPRALMCQTASSEIGLLYRLKKADLIGSGDNTERMASCLHDIGAYCGRPMDKTRFGEYAGHHVNQLLRDILKRVQFGLKGE